MKRERLNVEGCFWHCKVKNFESNSQPSKQFYGFHCVVFDIAKLKILKAIHNLKSRLIIAVNVVFDIAKLKILKAIHNFLLQNESKKKVVFDIAKLKILKAIHNDSTLKHLFRVLFLTLQS